MYMLLFILSITLSLYLIPQLAPGCSGIVWVKTKLCVASHSQFVLQLPELLIKETLQAPNFLQFAHTANLKIES